MSNLINKFCKTLDTTYLNNLYELDEGHAKMFMTESEKVLKNKKGNQKIAKIVVDFYKKKEKEEKAKWNKMKVPTIRYDTDEKYQKFIKPSFKEAIKFLREGKSEVVLIPIDDTTQEDIITSIEKDLPYMFKWYNDAVEEKYQVPPPTLKMMLEPHKTYDKWAPYIGKTTFPRRTDKFSVMGLGGTGMLNYYNGHVQNAMLKSKLIDDIFTESTGTKKWQAHTNRMRLNIVNKKGRDWSDSMHLEGSDVGLDSAVDRYGVIVAISKQRSFTWWEGTASDKSIRPDIREYYRKKGGVERNWIMIPKKEALTQPFFKDRRRKIIYDGSKYILLFTAAVAHEVDEEAASTSVFLSPFNPESPLEAINYQPINKRTWRAKTLYQPKEYTDNLTTIQTEIMGLGFHNAGAYWPSRKEVFFLNHQTSVGIWVKRVKPSYRCPTKDGKADKNVCYHLPTDGTVDQHTKEYRKKLKKIGITEIPEKVFDTNYPNLVVDMVKMYEDPMLQYRRCLRKDFPKD